MEKFGLSFKEAYAVAKNVEQQLRMSGSETVEEDMLAHVVAVTLEARFGREARLRYEATLSDPVDLYVVESAGTRLPYSRGILARSLMPIGLAPELAYALAKRTEAVLWQSGKRRVYRSEVRRLVNRLLNEEAGGACARRYALLHRLREAEQPVIILLGAAPGVGKSTVAAELGSRLGIPRMVSTDSVRQALRSLISKGLSPLLHESSYTAWRAELLPVELEQAQLDPVRVIRGFRVQIQQLATAVNAIIERNIQENMSLVMEGIHLVPGLSPLGTFENALVVEVMLSVEDEDNHRDHFALRERQTHARRDQDVYLDHYREIRILHDYLVDRARAEGVPVVDASDLDHAVDRAMELLLNALLVRGMIDGEEAGAVASGVHLDAAGVTPLPDCTAATGNPALRRTGVGTTPLLYRPGCGRNRSGCRPRGADVAARPGVPRLRGARGDPPGGHLPSAGWRLRQQGGRPRVRPGDAGDQRERPPAGLGRGHSARRRATRTAHTGRLPR